MLIEPEIEINITSRNLSYYLNLGYPAQYQKPLKIKTKDLPPNSHVKVKVKCGTCDKISEIRYHKFLENKKRHGYYSCKKCSNLKREKTNQKKFGVSNVMALEEFKTKIKETKKEKYGDENFNNIEQHKATNLTKYGVEFVLQDPYFHEKGKITKKEKYGNENFVNVPQRQKTKRLQYYEDIQTKYPHLEFLGVQDDLYLIKCPQGHIYKTTHKNLYQRITLYNTEACTICNPLTPAYSGQEKQIANFITQEYTGEISFNHKKLIEGELNIYLPEKKLAFEFNGLYWHNELYKDKNYHLQKTEACLTKGIQLIHIYEDDWQYKQPLVKSFILNKLGQSTHKIYARKCHLQEIKDNKVIRNFLDYNHLQGFVGSKTKLGLFYQGELVSLMTFGQKRKALGNQTQENTYELLRFCNKINTNVVGGASKLFKYFLLNYNPQEIVTYANRSYSNGQLYEKLGFEYIGKTPPNYFYVIKRQRKHRFNYRKDILVKAGADPNLTEHQIMLERKIYRIYDSGHLKFVLKNKT